MKVLVLDKLNTAPEVAEVLSLEHEVFTGLDRVSGASMVILVSTDEAELHEIESLLANSSDCVRLAHRSLLDNSFIWGRVESSVDDLFTDAVELSSRIPFILRRLVIRESRKRQFAAVFESTVEGIIIINTRGFIQLYNKAAEKIFQYSTSEVIGKNVNYLMPESYSRNHDRYLDNYLTTGKKKIIGIGREVSGLRKSGEIFPMDLAVSEFESEGKTFFVGIIRDVSERRRLEYEILRISEQERRRVGQDLHDGLGQMLTGISLIGRNMANRLEREQPELAEDMHEITDLVREADRMTRNIARGLVPVELEGDGMSAALRTLCSNAEKYFSVSCTYVEKGRVRISDSSEASNLYRIAQEAVSNAVKHGKAEEITVTLDTSPGSAVLTIEDNGVGFPEVLKEDRGMGVECKGYPIVLFNG
jgi:two-component system, LuxR family, sensor kinase FixL